MKKTKFLIISFLLIGLGATANDLPNLKNTVTRDVNPVIFKRIYKSFGISAGYLVPTENNNVYFSLSSDGSIVGKYNFSENKTDGWKLESTDPNYEKDAATIYDMDMGAGFTEDHEWDTSGYQPNEKPVFGCYGSNPLRYGDVFGDTKNQLVVNLTYYDLMWDWVIFSPETKNTVFSARLALQDFMSAESTQENTNKTYQHGSSWKQRYGHPGLRVYAKIYIDDFDKNGATDIVIWRKRYESRLGTDAVKGFELKKQLLAHYEPNEKGIFIRKSTEEKIIKDWLTSKSLTWQKGYPSKSECPGQEGQLIPEMHDPLLNDPDVLK